MCAKPEGSIDCDAPAVLRFRWHSQSRFFCPGACLRLAILRYHAIKKPGRCRVHGPMLAAHSIDALGSACFSLMVIRFGFIGIAESQETMSFYTGGWNKSCAICKVVYPRFHRAHPAGFCPSTLSRPSFGTCFAFFPD